jgi:hypothetical protein
MENPKPTSAPPSDPANTAQALEHITGAHEQLKSLRDRLGILNKHPELEEALTKLEMALNVLSVNTAGMW